MFEDLSEIEREELQKLLKELSEKIPGFNTLFAKVEDKMTLDELMFVHDSIFGTKFQINGILIWIGLLAVNMKQIAASTEENIINYNYFFVQFYEFLKLEDFFKDLLIAIGNTSELGIYPEKYIKQTNRILQLLMLLNQKITKDEMVTLEFMRNSASHPVLSKYFIQSNKKGLAMNVGDQSRIALRKSISEIAKKHPSLFIFANQLIQNYIEDFRIIKDEIEDWAKMTVP